MDHFFNSILGRCSGDHCTTASALKKGQYIASSNGVMKLIMQKDGNLVIYCRLKPIWSTKTNGALYDHMAFLADGNMVLVRADKVYAFSSSITPGKGRKLHIQKDGNLVIKDGNGNALWDTKTYGKCPTGI